MFGVNLCVKFYDSLSTTYQKEFVFPPAEQAGGWMGRWMVTAPDLPEQYGKNANNIAEDRQEQRNLPDILPPRFAMD
ncbi:MAG: hypothetical protein V2I33_16455 [Kangiellaceae bacterium]|jgi:hypothetical protein|nr:hypothetical protein [Kangiellaceae bacterium]